MLSTICVICSVLRTIYIHSAAYIHAQLTPFICTGAAVDGGCTWPSEWLLPARAACRRSGSCGHVFGESGDLKALVGFESSGGPVAFILS